MPHEECEEVADAAAVRARLQHVYWIGGGSGAGKSTIARRLAAQHGLHLYATDDAMGDHARRSTPEDVPFLNAFAAMDMDERWVNRSPEVMLETFHWFRGEGFGLIVEDLLRLPVETSVFAEGLRLLPHLVKRLLVRTDQAVWLLPTAEFRQAAIDSLQQWVGPPADQRDEAPRTARHRDRRRHERGRAGQAGDAGVRALTGGCGAERRGVGVAAKVASLALSTTPNEATSILASRPRLRQASTDVTARSRSLPCSTAPGASPSLVMIWLSLRGLTASEIAALRNSAKASTSTESG